MKTDIHPTFHMNVKAKCACGASFVVGSTMPEIRMEICSACHPFYTGKDKVLDTAGRVEKFRQRKAAATATKKTTKAKKTKA